jgi:hypothetical protein
MKLNLMKLFFAIVTLVMIAVAWWASTQCALWAIPKETIGHPWFIATLVDTYFAFFFFYIWVLYREPSLLVKILMFPLLIFLGNIVMGAYALIILFRLPPGAGVKDFFLNPAHR